MKNLFKKQSAKFVQNPSNFTKVMAKHILVCFIMPHSVCIENVENINQVTANHNTSVYYHLPEKNHHYQLQ